VTLKAFAARELEHILGDFGHLTIGTSVPVNGVHPAGKVKGCYHVISPKFLGKLSESIEKHDFSLRRNWLRRQI